MSGAKYFGVLPLNPYSQDADIADLNTAEQDVSIIRTTLSAAGIKVIQIEPPPKCQDGVFTANWGLCIDGKVIASRLPEPRKQEEVYARSAFRDLGLTVIEPPARFSGQGDALRCGEYLFVGSGYRTDPCMNQFLAEQFTHLKVIPLQTVPCMDKANTPVCNPLTGWPDSLFYDLDLALAVISPGLIAWCPQAFTSESQRRIRDLNIETIDVPWEDAVKGFACNLVSTGSEVIMSAFAPKLASELRRRGFTVTEISITELAKGGGFIRCTTLTLD